MWAEYFSSVSASGLLEAEEMLPVLGVDKSMVKFS